METSRATDASQTVTVTWVGTAVDQVLIKPTWRHTLPDIGALEEALNEALSRWPRSTAAIDASGEREFRTVSLTPERRSQLSHQTDRLLAQLSELTARRLAQRPSDPADVPEDADARGRVGIAGSPGSCRVTLARPWAEQAPGATLSEHVTAALQRWAPGAGPTPDPEQRRILAELDAIWAELGLPGH